MIFGSKLTNGLTLGGKLRGPTGTGFGHKLYAIGSIIKNGGEIYNKIGDIRNDLEKFRA